MAEMTPEEMEMMQQQAGKDSSGGATKLVQEVGKGLEKLNEMLNSAPGTTDKDRAQMQSIMDNFVDLVEKKLAGSAPGEDQEDPSEQMSQVPVDAGMSGKPMGPASRN